MEYWLNITSFVISCGFSIVLSLYDDRKCKEKLVAVFILVLAKAGIEWLAFPSLISFLLYSAVLLGCVMMIHRRIDASLILVTSIALYMECAIKYVSQFACAMISNRFWIKYYQYVLLSLDAKGMVYYLLMITALFIGCISMYPKIVNKIHHITEWNQCFLAGILFCMSILMTFLFHRMNHTYSYMVAQETITVALVSIAVIGPLLIGYACINSAKMNAEYEGDMLRLMNHAIRKQYDDLVNINEALRQQAHDHKKELLVLSEMTEYNRQAYIEDRLSVEMGENSFIHSGDPYIDAVITSRKDKIDKLDIEFKYAIATPQQISASPTDICAIVANLIDNAIEACERIDPQIKRWIHFSIDQKGEWIRISCSNSIVPGTVTPESIKSTSKSNHEHLHGYGIRNIRQSAQRNGGDVQFSIQDNSFTAEVLIQTV